MPLLLGLMHGSVRSRSQNIHASTAEDDCVLAQQCVVIESIVSSLFEADHIQLLSEHKSILPMRQRHGSSEFVSLIIRGMSHQPSQMATTDVLRAKAKMCEHIPQANQRAQAEHVCLHLQHAFHAGSCVVYDDTHDRTKSTGSMLCLTATFARAQCPCMKQCLCLTTSATRVLSFL